MSSNIGRLQRVALREVWKHEALDFTQWLQHNIEVLNETLDLNLTGADDVPIGGTGRRWRGWWAFHKS